MTIDKPLQLFIGKEIGKGRDRHVYEFTFDSAYVVKVDQSDRFANIIEWDVWNTVNKHLPTISHFFAPCHSISSCGTLLLQKKTIPIPGTIELSIPAFLWDNRRCNWGMLDGSPVMHDYSSHSLYKHVSLDLVRTVIL